MYNIGEKVFYGAVGVCEVVDITPQKPLNCREEKLYYVLRPMNKRLSVTIPVDSDKVYLRPILTGEEAEALLGRISDVQLDDYNGYSMRQMQESYGAVMKTRDSIALMRLTMSLYAKKLQAERLKKKFGSVDEQFLKRSEDLLYGELATALNKSFAEIREYVMSRVRLTAVK